MKANCVKGRAEISSNLGDHGVKISSKNELVTSYPWPCLEQFCQYVSEVGTNQLSRCYSQQWCQNAERQTFAPPHLRLRDVGTSKTSQTWGERNRTGFSRKGRDQASSANEYMAVAHPYTGRVEPGCQDWKAKRALSGLIGCGLLFGYVSGKILIGLHKSYPLFGYAMAFLQIATHAHHPSSRRDTTHRQYVGALALETIHA